MKWYKSSRDGTLMPESARNETQVNPSNNTTMTTSIRDYRGSALTGAASRAPNEDNSIDKSNFRVDYSVTTFGNVGGRQIHMISVRIILIAYKAHSRETNKRWYMEEFRQDKPRNSGKQAKLLPTFLDIGDSPSSSKLSISPLSLKLLRHHGGNANTGIHRDTPPFQAAYTLQLSHCPISFRLETHANNLSWARKSLFLNSNSSKTNYGNAQEGVPGTVYHSKKVTSQQQNNWKALDYGGEKYQQATDSHASFNYETNIHGFRTESTPFSDYPSSIFTSIGNDFHADQNPNFGIESNLGSNEKPTTRSSKSISMRKLKKAQSLTMPSLQSLQYDDRYQCMRTARGGRAIWVYSFLNLVNYAHYGQVDAQGNTVNPNPAPILQTRVVPAFLDNSYYRDERCDSKVAYRAQIQVW
jgi:hypothetical protein